MLNYYPEDIDAERLCVKSKPASTTKIGSLGELDIFKRLVKEFENEPDFFIRWCTKLHPPDVEGFEIDVLIMRDNYGIVNLEIKTWGGKLSVNNKGLMSQKHGGAKDKDPHDQATKALYRFEKFLKVAHNDLFMQPIVLMPLQEKTDLDALENLHNKKYFWGKEISDNPASLKSNIMNVLSKKNVSENQRENMIRMQRKLRSQLRKESLEYEIEIQAYKESQKEILEKTQQLQNKFLQENLKHKNWLVFGQAGTGKTYVALQLAQALRKKGKKGIYIVYNDNVRDHIAELMTKFSLGKGNLEIFTLAALCKEFTKKKAVILPQTNPPPAILSELRKKFKNLKDTERFDFMIVDEMQDITLDTINVMRTILKNSNDGCYFFLDPRQQLYLKKRETIDQKEYERQLRKEIPEIEICELPFVIRNTNEIYVHTSKKVPNHWNSGCTNKNGIPVEYATAFSYADLHTRTEDFIKKMTQAGIKPENITILGCTKIDSFFRKNDPHKIGAYKVRISKSKGEMNENTIQFWEASKFKGCENDIIILWWNKDLPLRSPLLESVYYVAASRAKLMLFEINFKKPSRKK